MPPLTSWLPDRLPDLLASPLAARLGWTCLHSLWQALAIASLLDPSLGLDGTAALDLDVLRDEAELFGYPHGQRTSGFERGGFHLWRYVSPFWWGVKKPALSIIIS
jgi:hypothetical protein